MHRFRVSALQSVGRSNVAQAPRSSVIPNLRLGGGEDFCHGRARGFTCPFMGKTAVLTWYPWYVDKWRSNRKVARMTPAERGIYRELLDECWLEGSIPSDPDELCEIAHCTRAELDVAWPAIWKCFSERADGRFVNAKIAAVLLAQAEALARQKDGGRRGGKSTQAKLKAALSQPQAKREIEISLPARARVEDAPPTDNGTARDMHGRPFADSPPPCPHCNATVEDSGKRVQLVHEWSCPQR